MSFYGKKALENWDYSNIDVLRFIKSPKKIQLSILEKWYPIGENCLYLYGSNEEFATIEAYSAYSNFYMILLDTKVGKVNVNLSKIKMPRMERDLKILNLIRKKDT